MIPPEQQLVRDRCVHPGGSFLEFRKEEIEQSIPARFQQQVRRYPQRIALKTRTHELTYEALDQASNRVAHAILARRGEREEPIALLFDPGASFVIASLGVLKAGKIAVPLESTFPRARLNYMLEQSQAGGLVTGSVNLPLARELTSLPTINMDELDKDLSIAAPAVSILLDAPVAIGYTSGSTGEPKGIVWNHRGMLHAVMRHTNVYRLCMHDRLMTFRASIRAYLYALLNGAAYFPVHLHQAEPAHVARWLMEQEITIYRASVSAFRSLAGSLTGSEKFPHLRLIALFGEPVYHTEVELFQRHFAKHSILASSLGCNEFDDYACFFLDKDTSLPGGVVPGGYPINDVDVLLLDGSGRKLGVDTIGELAVRSRYNAVGYWRRPDLTETAFLSDPVGGDERIYCTGDMGRMGLDGCLFHLGRKDFQVKIRGYRVEVAEVETALLGMDGVKEAVVIGREDNPGDKRLVAYIVPTQTLMPTATELRRGLINKVPDYMVPSTFVMLDSLPLTATGKVDRRALPAPSGVRPKLEQEFIEPRSSSELALAGIWCDVLVLKQVGLHDNFFDLGGNSLLATRVISRLRSATHAEVLLRALFETPTIAGLAAVVDQYLSQETPDTMGEGLSISRHTADGPVPLSFAQQRLWFLDQWQVESAAYNIFEGILMDGDIDVSALERSFTEIVRRHEVLRTTFSVDGNSPSQIIHETWPFSLQRVDLSSMSQESREAEVRRLASAEAVRPFDLARGPLLRATLLQLEPGKQMVHLTMHHIVSDGWSMDVLHRELAALYEAYAKGGTSPLRELPIQYADFTVWQRQSLQGNGLSRQLGYWRKQLRGLPALDLPADHPRLPVQGFRGARRAFRVSKELMEALESLSRQEGVTLFMTLMAGFQGLLSCYTAQQDIVVGTPIAGRTRPELEELIGFFVNMLVFRSDLSADTTFRELLGRVRKVALDAYMNQDVPFEKLVEELHPQRDPSRNPLFQVVFALQNGPRSEPSLSGLTLTRINLDSSRVRFDLEVQVIKSTNGLDGWFIYNTDLFEAATIMRMAGHFLRLLEGVVANPNHRAFSVATADGEGTPPSARGVEQYSYSLSPRCKYP